MPSGTAHDAIAPDRDKLRSGLSDRTESRTEGLRSTTEAEPVIALAEERVRIDKRSVEGERIRVSTRTETIEEVLRETLRSDAVGVSRLPVDRVIAEGEAAPQVRTEAGVTIIPVLEEVLVVEKRLVLREEIHIRQTTSGEDVEVPVTLRTQRAAIEHLGPDGQPLQPKQTEPHMQTETKEETTP